MSQLLALPSNSRVSFMLVRAGRVAGDINYRRLTLPLRIMGPSKPTRSPTAEGNGRAPCKRSSSWSPCADSEWRRSCTSRRKLEGGSLDRRWSSEDATLGCSRGEASALSASNQVSSQGLVTSSDWENINPLPSSEKVLGASQFSCSWECRYSRPWVVPHRVPQAWRPMGCVNVMNPAIP